MVAFGCNSSCFTNISCTNLHLNLLRHPAPVPESGLKWGCSRAASPIFAEGAPRTSSVFGLLHLPIRMTSTASPHQLFHSTLSLCYSPNAVVFL